MTTFEQRENAFEAEFAHGEELEFRARERAIRSLALWAAQLLGKTGKAADAYALELVGIDVASAARESTLERVAKDLDATGVGMQEIRRTMEQFLAREEAAVRGSVS